MVLNCSGCKDHESKLKPEEGEVLYEKEGTPAERFVIPFIEEIPALPKKSPTPSPDDDCLPETDARVESTQALTLEKLRERLESAHAALRALRRGDALNEAVLFQCRLSHLTIQVENRTITAEEAGVERNRIAFSVDEFLKINNLLGLEVP